MKAYVSLHTAQPNSQIDHEVGYVGYERIEVDFDENFGTAPLNLTFAPIQEDSDEVVTYIAVGPAEKGQGEIFMRIQAIPNIPILSAPERRTVQFWLDNGAAPEQIDALIESHGYVAPRIAICNTDPVALPENLNPIARVAHQLVYSGLMRADELHPKLYEAINDALHNAGVPVLKVVRTGAADMKAKLSQMPSLDFTEAAGNA